MKKAVHKILKHIFKLFYKRLEISSKIAAGMQIFTWLYHTRQNCTKEKAQHQQTCLHGQISPAGKASFNLAHPDVWFSPQVTDKTYTSLVLACVDKALGTHDNDKTVYTNYLYIHYTQCTWSWQCWKCLKKRQTKQKYIWLPFQIQNDVA